jgi:signal peptidase I
MNGLLARPAGFETLGPISSPGPLRILLGAIVAGAVLVMGGAAYGPIAKRAGRKTGTARTEPTGVR